MKKQKKYYLIEDLSEDIKQFEENKNKIQYESEKVVKKLMDYLKESNKNFNKLTLEETKKLLYIFLEKNGFITLDNIEELKNIEKYKTDQVNYYIAKFILKENEDNTIVFNNIYKIVCGFMLANTIYIQVENDNKASLKNLNCYLDTPIILNLLELKTEEENNSAQLLVELLEKKEKVLGPDIDSISAISRLRKGEYCTKLEDSKAIFITNNYNLIKYSNMFLKKKDFEEISYSISDVELTTILWLKTFKANPDLPKFKLIENARLALEPSNQIMERFKDAIEKMKEEDLINDTDVLENLKTNLYYKTELMERIGGDGDNITNEVVIGIIDKKTENLQLKLNVANETINQLKREKQLNENKKIDTKKLIEKECLNKATTISKRIGRILNILFFLISIIIIGYCIYITYKDMFITKNINFSTIVLFLIAAWGIIDMSFSKMHIMINLIKRTQDKIQEMLYNKFLKLEKNKRKDLYN